MDGPRPKLGLKSLARDESTTQLSSAVGARVRQIYCRASLSVAVFPFCRQIPRHRLVSLFVLFMQLPTLDVVVSGSSSRMAKGSRQLAGAVFV